MRIDKICRACLREDKNMVNMSKKDIYQKFLLFANQTAEETEIPKMSLNLCQSCEQKLKMVFDFKELCQTSHMILLNYVKNTPEIYSAVASVNKRSKLQRFPQNQVWKAIEDLTCYENMNCIRCSYVAGTKRLLSIHISQKHKDLKPRWCNACNKEFDNLPDHIATNHDYTCKFCSRNCKTLRYLTAHLRNHSDVDSVQCSFCNKLFSSQSSLNTHLKSHPKRQPHKCGLCDKLFFEPLKFKQHLKVHKREGDAVKQLPLHKCKYCDKKYNTSIKLTEHVRTHTGEKPYVCQVCGRGFARKSTIRAHMFVHNIGNKISCNVCNKKFNGSFELRRHLYIHTGETPYVCNECGKGFIRKGHLIEHIKVHSNFYSYKCSYCVKAFKHANAFKDHMLKHSGKKPFKCNQCSYACRRSDYLTNHMKKHVVDKPQADRPHVCLMCNKTFTTDAMLTCHINTHNVSFLEI